MLSTAPAVTSLSVVRAGSGVVVEPLGNNAILNLSSLGKINVRANANGSAVESVVFKLDGKSMGTENHAPFDADGDVGNSSSPDAWSIAAGSHSLSVTPYSKVSGTGVAGATVTVTFSVTVSTTAAFPTSIQWTTGKDSPIVRAEAVGAAVGGKLYVFGGFDNEGSETTSIPLQHRCDVYDPATNTWTRLTDFPEPFSHSGPAIVGTDLWFVGGYVGNHPGPGTTHVWIYHTTNDTWTRGPDLPVARGAGSAALVGHTIYITGGMDMTRTNEMPSTYALDLNNLSAGWVRKADNPNGRNHVAAASLGGFYYEIGGQHGQEDAEDAQSEVDRYDPNTNKWTKVASLPVGLGHVTGDALVYDGRIILVGGDLKHNDPQRSIYSYDPAANKWSLLALLPAARSTPVVGIIGNKLVVTTGNGPDATDETWVGVMS